jgi:hypothetical protein
MKTKPKLIHDQESSFFSFLMVSMGQESKKACCFARVEHSSPMEILAHKKYGLLPMLGYAY